MVKALFFDFDYTLADSSLGIIESCKYALKKLNYDLPDDNAIKKTIGLNLVNTFKKLTDSNDENLALRYRELFLERAAEIMIQNTHLYQEVHDLFKTLYQNKYQLGIISTKNRDIIEAVLTRDKLINYLDVIVGGEDVINHKPHAEGLLLACEKINIQPKQVIYTGDSIIDALTAKHSGVKGFVSVLTGTTTRDEFQSYNCLSILEHVKQIPEFLNSTKFDDERHQQ